MRGTKSHGCREHQRTSENAQDEILRNSHLGLFHGDIVVLVAHSLNNIVRKVILKKEQKKKKIQLEGA